jgi:spermidine/putrescine transport system substrate-binding protein
MEEPMEEQTTTVRARALSRRQLLQASAAAGVAAFLAACTGGGASPTAGGASPTQAATDEATDTATGEPTEAAVEGPLNFANWPAYIDLNEEETESPTLVAFQEEYGIEVNYQEEIQANEDFVATIQPQLQAGLDTGWDLMVLTDYMAARLVNNGWLEEIDHANTPTALENVRDELKGYEWDPDFKFHFPWQSGATGVGYNSVSTGRELTKTADLFDPAFAGKATLLSGYQDTFSLIGLMLRAQGELENTPPDMTVEDGQVIHDYLKPFVDSGHIRAFTGNEYLQDFGSGDTWVAVVYSGDLASSAGENDVFVYPEEGSVIWTDNMVIPKGAQHKRAAEAMIDFVYDVDRAAQLANWIYYISPVKGVAEAIVELDPEAAENPLLFPPPEVTEKQFGFPNVTDEEDAQLNELVADLEGT